MGSVDKQKTDVLNDSTVSDGNHNYFKSSEVPPLPNNGTFLGFFLATYLDVCMSVKHNKL